MKKEKKVRVPENTINKIRSVNKCENLHEALTHFTQLIYNEDYYLTEVGTPIKYDPNSGEPLEWAWSPGQRIQQVDGSYFFYRDELDHFLHYRKPNIPKTVFNKTMISLIKDTLVDKDPVYFGVDGKRYIISTHVVASTDDDSCGTVRAERIPGMIILPLNKKMTIEGIVNLIGKF